MGANRRCQRARSGDYGGQNSRSHGPQHRLNRWERATRGVRFFRFLNAALGLWLERYRGLGRNGFASGRHRAGMTGRSTLGAVLTTQVPVQVRPFYREQAASKSKRLRRSGFQTTCVPPDCPPTFAGETLLGEGLGEDTRIFHYYLK